MSRRLMLVVFLAGAVSFAQSDARVGLGKLSTGAAVSFVRTGSEYGIEIAGGSTPRIMQQQPAQLEVFRSESDIRQFAAGYRNVEKAAGGVAARAEIAFDKVTFRIEDRWSVSGEVLTVRRNVQVVGNAPGSAFNSALMLATTPETPAEGVEYFVPSVLYRGPSGNEGPGAGRAQRIAFREDSMAATMVGMSFKSGASITMLDPAPRGDTTYEDVGNRVTSVLLDDRIKFGAFGSFPRAEGGVEFGFWYPGSMPAPVKVADAPQAPGAAPARGGAGGARQSQLLRRYHRIRDGYAHDYETRFRFAQNETFPVLTRNAWRWAWQVLNPPVTYLDVDLVRGVLLDHLADRVMTVEGRTGIPWIFQATSGLVWNRPDDMRCAMGFVGKNIEAADQLLRESDRDQSARGQRMRKLGWGSSSHLSVWFP